MVFLGFSTGFFSIIGGVSCLVILTLLGLGSSGFGVTVILFGTTFYFSGTISYGRGGAIYYTGL